MERLETQDPVSRALAEIEAIRSALYAAGAVDDEPSRLDAIVRDLSRGKITADQARLAVRRIRDARSEYH